MRAERGVATILTAAVLLAGSCANAVEMMAGGLGVNPSAYFGSPGAALHSDLTFGSSSAWGLPQASFTPRSSGAVWSHGLGAQDAPTLSVSLEAASLGRLDDSLVSRHIGRRDSGQNLIVGGALQLRDVGVLGGVGRTQLFGASTDMVAAGLSYGPLRARFAYGPGDPEQSGVRDVMMFSTDLAAWSWLTLEGDVAFGETVEDGDRAMGRVGIKLRF